VQEGDLVVEVIDPAAVRFRGFALQADISMIQDGANVRIVPPHGGIASYTEVVEAAMRLGTEADPDERTIDLVATPTGGDLPAWARPGVAAFVEVVTRGWEDSELAIPLGAVATDGLERVFFLRDRANPDQVRRVVADLGADDGRWIVVNSGVRPGDEVVLSGVHELRLTGSGKEQQGGHFHSDGTFHEAEH
jgi:multidrug efflux pump subunit AcrA (membrane-fusion protein)